MTNEDEKKPAEGRGREPHLAAEPGGLVFFRCLMCASVVSVWDIREHGGCRRCGGTRVRPANLTWWEKIVQVIRHPRIWTWKEMGL